MVHDEIKKVFDLYLQSYFTERNYEKLVQLFHSDFCVIGTGKDEVAFSCSYSLALYARDLDQYKESIPYELNFVKIIDISPVIGLVLAGINVDLKIHEIGTRIEGLRMSMILVRQEEKWLIYHLHISKDHSILEEGEAFPYKEINERRIWLEKMVDERTRELNQALEDVEISAITDHLTGIYNRRKFNQVLTQELIKANENGHIFSIILCDLDHFKKVNDNFGHIVGDYVLKETANILKANIRLEDTLARWGGEEFAILLPDTSLQIAITVAERLREIIRNAQFKSGISLTMSFGIAEYIPYDTEDTILKRADDALYRAKNNGRNRVEI